MLLTNLGHEPPPQETFVETEASTNIRCECCSVRGSSSLGQKPATNKENYDNRFIIVHFWASWCMECQGELLALNKLQKEFRKKALLVFAISEDFKGIGAIDEYFTKHQIDYLDLYSDKKSKIYQSLNVNHLPVSYLVDFDGKVIAQSIPGSIVDWNNEELKEYLEAKVSKYQLLPPEFKKSRDKYEPPKQAVENKTLDQKNKETKKNKSHLFIN